ncbi:hypothetical protein A2291_04935 [candidate division WOR-1 bacterium RIFOXYB2_FULL_42_35]|uniref:Uncharacterized protein n=1 Tax=candidate division WOR-1 bacterium RIFOXYC2_FULL_41_25 TaxID=1802586 RepID=A0A1F4TNS6_UNCSA|nr:MAG: hypothetical protein A2247_07135 [candidate division WOR-1 bacterium RIFOXYA2_FULL_41_14]OGC24675.1 MAG: hypothetical protein A2291_04935 [candidate division WOR-1 bacterium RIFOXYB2_FULL_42_35]OGC34190.1 MAG: hypothetical protein A2462_08180 [candidate division WOR-1 bacterium RIFOXYC2_FULL_41_25]
MRIKEFKIIVLLGIFAFSLILVSGCNNQVNVTIPTTSTTTTTSAPTTTTTTTLTSNPTAEPSSTVKLIFLHHSSGRNWLADADGGLGIALRDSNYFVSDTNYGWGPSSIGDNTDFGNWWTWFRGANYSTIMSAVYAESGQHDEGYTYSRLSTDPGGENEVIMFKSCYPNNDNLAGDPSADPPAIGSNGLKGQNCYSGYHLIENAKGIYNDLLNYFSTRQDKLFIVITAPPVQSGTNAGNARAFAQWLVDDWLDGYSYDNVAVFDFYNVLTSKTGSGSNDLGLSTGNHHRWWSGSLQYKTNDGANTSAYPTSGGDDHPNQAGNLKATGEFVSVLNYYYNRWKGLTP